MCIVELRGVTPEDLDTIYIWENDSSLWEFGAGCAQYSLAELWHFFDSQARNLVVDGQQRLMIYGEGSAVGAVDIFEYNPTLGSAGVGILVDAAHRGRGFAKRALLELESYLIDSYGVEELWCDVAKENSASLNLFGSCEYVERERGGEFLRLQKNLQKK